MTGELTVLNIRDYLSEWKSTVLGETLLYQLLDDYSCGKNPDVERFLKEQSIAFARKNQSVTYLVFSQREDSLAGYFTLAIKPVSINAENFSNAMKRKIARVSRLEEDGNTYILSAYLVAQLGKNFSNGADEEITGRQLLQAAIHTIKELQYMAGGMVMFLEAENEEKLVRFYEEQNNFKRFSTRKINTDTGEPRVLIQFLKVL